jgi:hypothetical protein
MVMAALTRAQELMVAEASVQPLRWHATLTWGAVQPWSVPPPWRTRINHKIQKRIAIKQDRSDPTIAPRRRWPAALARVAYHNSPKHLYSNSGQVKHLPQARIETLRIHRKSRLAIHPNSHPKTGTPGPQTVARGSERSRRLATLTLAISKVTHATACAWRPDLRPHPAAAGGPLWSRRVARPGGLTQRTSPAKEGT